MGSVFYTIYQFISKRRWQSAVLLLLVFLGSAFVVSKIQFEEDITKLIPVHAKNKDFKKVLETVNFTDKIIVNIQRGNNGSSDDLTQYASQLLDSLNTTSKKHFKNIQGKVTDDDVLKRWILYIRTSLFF